MTVTGPNEKVRGVLRVLQLWDPEAPVKVAVRGKIALEIYSIRRLHAIPVGWLLATWQKWKEPGW